MGAVPNFSVIDQWPGKKPLSESLISAYTNEEVKRLGKPPSSNANEYHVVIVR